MKYARFNIIMGITSASSAKASASGCVWQIMGTGSPIMCPMLT